MSLPRTQRRFARSRIEPGVSNLSINSPTLYQLCYRHRAEFQCSDTLRTGVGGRGAGGHWPPPVGERCPNFGQFHIFWAIYVKISGDFIFIGQYCVKILGNFMSSLPSKIFRALDRKTVSMWVNTFFFIFMEVSTIWTEKPAQFEWRLFFFDSPQFGQKKRLIWHATFKSFFKQNFGAPQIILSSYAHDLTTNNSNLEVNLLANSCLQRVTTAPVIMLLRKSFSAFKNIFARIKEQY